MIMIYNYISFSIEVIVFVNYEYIRQNRNEYNNLLQL